VAGQTKGRSTLIYAGVNSGPADLQKGKNEHLRVLSVDQASKAKAATGPKIAELARSTLFAAKDEDTYQRLLRVTVPYAGVSQLGAVGTGLSKTPQIALFDISAGASVGPRARGSLDLSRDAQDLDVIQTGTEQHQLAYCSEYELFLFDIAKGAAPEPALVYEIDSSESPRPTFRAIRYLTPNFLLAVLNVPRQGGVILHGFRSPRPGQDRARIAVSAKLPKAVRQATSLAVRDLSPPTDPAAKHGEAQFVVAVAGNNSSISLYTLDYQVAGSADAMVNLFPFKTLNNIHEQGAITGLAFSYFVTPKTTSRAQFLKLASVSVANTVTVHTIALKKVIDKATTAKRPGPPRQPRYVVGLKSQRPSGANLLAIIATGFAIIAILLQSALEISGLVPSRLGASRALPASWSRPYVPLNPGPVKPHGGALLSLLETHKDGLLKAEEGKPPRRMLLRDDDLTRVEGQAPRLQIVIHNGDEDEGGKEWDDLSPKQQARWKRKLKSAGHWTEEHGEGIFRDILFAEIAGAVGAAVAG
jgi:hypothetical protein